MQPLDASPKDCQVNYFPRSFGIIGLIVMLMAVAVDRVSPLHGRTTTTPGESGPMMCFNPVDPNVFEDSTNLSFGGYSFPINQFWLRAYDLTPDYYRCLYVPDPLRPLDTSRLYYWDQARLQARSYKWFGIPVLEVEEKLGEVKGAGWAVLTSPTIMSDTTSG